jgi:hypothetical protein
MDNESNEAILRAVKHLLDDNSASNIQKSLASLQREFLTSFEAGVFPLDYHDVINDYYFLTDFLEKLEKVDVSQ